MNVDTDNLRVKTLLGLLLKACPHLFSKPATLLPETATSSPETGDFVAVSGDYSSGDKIAGFGSSCGQAFTLKVGLGPWKLNCCIVPRLLLVTVCF